MIHWAIHYWQAGVSPNLPASPEGLKDRRNSLNALSTALHSPTLDGLPKPFEIISRLISFSGKGVPAPLKEEPDFVGLSDDDQVKLGADLVDIENATSTGRGLSDHPYLGFGALDLQPTDLARIHTEANALRDDLRVLEKDVVDASKFVGVSSSDSSFATIENLIETLALLGTAPNPDQKGSSTLRAHLLTSPDNKALTKFVETGRDWAAAKNKASAKINAAGLDADWSHLRSPIAQGTGSFFKRWGSAYRGAQAELRSLLKSPEKLKAPAALALVDEMIALKNLRQQIERESPQHSSTLCDVWKEENTDFRNLLEELTFVSNLPKTGFDLSFSFFRQHDSPLTVKIV